MFMDLVKGAKRAPKSSKKDNEEISDERLDEIMAELFGGSSSSDDEDDEKAEKGKKAMMPRADLLRASEEDDEDDEDDEEEDMEKGMSRRDMMDKVYSMVDDLSEEELSQFLSSREIKKAQAMAIFSQMSNSDLRELVSVAEANGSKLREPLAMKGGNYDMMDMDKGEDYFKADDDEDLEDLD